MYIFANCVLEDLWSNSSDTRQVHSKKCNVRLPYVKHALNVRRKTYIKRMDRAPYV